MSAQGPTKHAVYEGRQQDSRDEPAEILQHLRWLCEQGGGKRPRRQGRGGGKWGDGEGAL